MKTNLNEAKVKNMKTGYYLLSNKIKPTGANRVSFQISGERINVNDAGFRAATEREINSLLAAEIKTIEATTVLSCPECGSRMLVRYDRIAKDWTSQCPNKNCNHDGDFANTVEELSAN